MTLPSILKRASDLFYGRQEINPQTTYEDGEVIFCKNNVCLHPRVEKNNNVVHHPGYLTIICQYKNPNKYTTDPTLILTWIPNTTLQRNSEYDVLERLAENEVTARKSDNQEILDFFSGFNIERTNSIGSIDSSCSGCLSHEPSIGSATSSSPDLTVLDNCAVDCFASDQYLSGIAEKSKQNEYNSEFVNNANKNKNTRSMQENINQKCNVKSYVNSSHTVYNKMSSISASPIDTEKDCTNGVNANVRSDNNINSTMRRCNSNQAIVDHCASVVERFSISDVNNKTINGCEYSDSNKYNSSKYIKNISFCAPSEYYGPKHNLNFPEAFAPSTWRLKRRSRSCKAFSIDLGEMRSLRLFFNHVDSTSGQLVIGSREGQYKILHFHHGSLEKLSTILDRWNLFISKPVTTVDGLPTYKHFSVYQPQVTESELHPEEGHVERLTEEMWFELQNDLGQIEDEFKLRKLIFFCGIPSNLRKDTWPFLLHCYSYQSTYEERLCIQEARRLKYENIQERRMNLDGYEKEVFIRNIECVVEKDVIRTDRSNPFYAGDDNPNLQIMKNILLNYAVYNSKHGYSQGMSDLLAPILAEINDEVDSFWCFVGVMKKGLFICTPTDSDMERNLYCLRELIRIMYPPFYTYLQRHSDGMDLLFCHRWLLLCFKREFPDDVAITIWEACWSNYLTDYFHLFLSLAIIIIYSEDIITQDLRTDETLFHFSSLAMYMDGHMVLRKARGLLYAFHLLTEIPCTLASLCQQSDPAGVWDSCRLPVVKCAELPYCQDSPCPFAKRKC